MKVWKRDSGSLQSSSETKDFMGKIQLITDPEKGQQVLEAWGDHLSNQKGFEDAAIIYLCCSRLEKALKAYRDCGDWGGMLRVAGLLKLGKDEIPKVAYELCEDLNAGNPGELKQQKLLSSIMEM